MTHNINCSPPTCLPPNGKILYVNKGGHNDPECYISGYIKRLGANHIKTFSWVPKDSNTDENKDSTIDPLFSLWLFFIVTIILRFLVTVDSKNLMIGRIKASSFWNTT